MSSSDIDLPIPSEVSFVEAMKRLRMWFDSKKIQPRTFRLKDDGAVFAISFETEADASIFNAGFEWSLPPV
jgi:hypothetical protein